MDEPANARMWLLLGDELPPLKSGRPRDPYMHQGCHPDVVARVWDELGKELPREPRSPRRMTDQLLALGLQPGPLGLVGLLVDVAPVEALSEPGQSGVELGDGVLLSVAGPAAAGIREGQGPARELPVAPFAGRAHHQAAYRRQGRARAARPGADARASSARQELSPRQMASKVSPLAPASVPAMPDIAGVRFATAAAGIRYAGRTDVLLVALDKGTGKTVWQFKTGSSINSTAITYTHNGRQYVTVASGLGGGLANRYAADKVPAGGSVWTFALMNN